MRTCHTTWLLALSAAVIAACSGDDGGTTIDARPPIDAPTCTPVDDSNECTTDECVAGQPVNTPRTGATCTGGGTCNASGTCVPAASCTDGQMNGTETGVDCGGSCAPARTCDTGAGCTVPADCTSGVCSGTPMTCQAPDCGDGVMQAGEMCDDGNNMNGDGCDDGVGGTCRPTGCGNGVTTGTETCDDGNAMNGDGCDNNCTVTGCGNGVTTGTETCDDGDTMGGDGCSATCAPEAGYTCTAAVPSVCTATCGDGIIAVGAETCDQGMGNQTPGDGCSAACAIETGWACTGAVSTCAPICGDGMIIAPEVCDDSNTTNLDGCSATCRNEVTEVEPNEDGTPSTGGTTTAGNDFDIGGMLAVNNATAQGLIRASAGSVNWLAAISVGPAPGTAGDEDVFAITNDTASPQTLQLDVWNRGTGFGFGVSCGTTSIDTAINVRDAAGVLLASGDDRVATIDYCSRAVINLTAGQTVYAQVVEYGDNAVIPSYGLQVQFTPIVCGDNVVAGGIAQCDDGNTAANDGCSSTCQYDVGCPTGQTLVNVANTTATAIPDNDTVTGVSSTAAVATAGAVASVRVAIGDLTHLNDADLDIFLRSPAGIQRELSTDNGGTGDNYTNTLFVDSALTAIPTGVAPMTGPFRGEQSLSTTIGTDFRGLNAAGTWTLRVFDDLATNTGSLNAWNLYVCIDPTAIYCGDSIRNGTEECDDGNAVDNDACNNLCQITDGCGDGNIDAGELCDDNNLAAGDGCSATCTPDITCAAGETPVIVTRSPAAAIPDTYAGLLDLANVTASGLVRKAIVTVDVAHANTGHVDMYLMSPFGGQRLLSDDNGGVNYTATQFSDAATAAITSATTGAHTGLFRPEQTLAGFNGQAAQGTWALRVGDDTTGTTGTLNSWTVALCVDPATNHTCGNGVVETGETCDDGNTTAADGCSDTCAIELGCTAGQTAVITTSTDGPLLVPDNNATGITSTMSVVATGNVAKAVVVINALGHTWSGDVNLTLTSPAATALDLSSGNGSSGDDFLSTMFDDGAATAVTAGTAPFRGRFRPEVALAGVNTQAGAGTWSLKVVDTATGDTGMLRSWTVGLCVQ